MWKKERMLKSMFYITAILLAVLVTSSCEKIIQVDLGDAPNQFVIEGVITDQEEAQLVKLSRSVPFSETNSFPAVQGATVKVSDDTGNNWIFTETQTGNYTNTFKGVPGRTYFLTVETDGKSYTATSKMPAAVALDSVSVREITFGGKVTRQIQAHYKDPELQSNFYRFLLFINGKQSKSVYADNDRFTDGNFVKTLLFHDDDNQEKIEPGATASVQMQCIDPNIFTYWYTLAQQSMNGPGGGTAPGNPPSNISNGALGYFSAQTQDIKSLKVK